MLTKDTVWILSQFESRFESFLRSEQKNQRAKFISKCAPLALIGYVSQVVAHQHLNDAVITTVMEIITS